MPAISATLIGVMASIFTGISLLPQLFKLYRERQAAEVSVLMLAILLLGCALWIVYGFMKEDYVIIGSNSFSVLVNISTWILWVCYRNKKE